jgi:hypothetical protein
MNKSDAFKALEALNLAICDAAKAAVENGPAVPSGYCGAYEREMARRCVEVRAALAAARAAAAPGMPGAGLVSSCAYINGISAALERALERFPFEAAADVISNRRNDNATVQD